MCLINFHFKDHPTYKLIVVANRDEVYDRPTAPAHIWEDKPMILAGRDLLQKGTWLGVTKNGRFAALTNFRNPSDTNEYPTSRGDIVTDFLVSNDSPQDFLSDLAINRDQYAGFNIIVGDSEQLYYYNNNENQIKSISPGTHSLSNQFLNSSWPKVTKGRKKLHNYVQNKEAVQVEDLFTIISDAEKAPDHELPSTGIPIELERKLSPLFIKTDNYGTRSSTIVTIDHDYNLQFTERTYDKGIFVSDKQFAFSTKNKSV